jgi:rhamnosyltransferase
MNTICALIVTYQPDTAQLSRMVSVLISQVDKILIVDNGCGETLSGITSEFSEKPVDLLALGSNLGLATAQNKGIEKIREQNFSHVILFDQDSLPESNMVQVLINGLTEIEKTGQKVAAVGPVYIDPRTQQAQPFACFPGLRVKRTFCSEVNSFIQADFLIASGTLITMSNLKEIGLFEEDLFIDNIDLEWSFRAAQKGFNLYGICAARMEHYLGDKMVRIWLGRWWNVYRHSPLRQYYMARNRMVLYQRSYSPRGWIVQDMIRFLIKLFWFGIIFGPRLKNLAMIWRGTVDGLKNRLGKFSQ